MGWNRTTTTIRVRRQELESGRDKCACGHWKCTTDYVCEGCWLKSLDRQGRSPKARVPHMTLVWSPDDTWTVGGMWFMRDLKVTLEMGHMTPGTVFKGSQTDNLYVVTEDMRLVEG